MAASHVKQAELERGNIILTTRLNYSIAETKTKQKNLAEAQQKTAEAQQREAEARQKLQETLEEVRRRQLPRELTPEKMQQLIKVLQNGPKGTVYVSFPNGNEEAHAFAIELDNVLAEAGWTSIGTTAVISPVVQFGLNIQVRDAKTAPYFAGFLQRSLSEVGLTAQGQDMSGLPEGQVILFVGNKPD